MSSSHHLLNPTHLSTQKASGPADRLCPEPATGPSGPEGLGSRAAERGTKYQSLYSQGYASKSD